MRIEKYKIEEHNQSSLKEHKRKFDFIAAEVNNVEDILQKLIDFQVAIPSWALGTGGTRFGRFQAAASHEILKKKLKTLVCCMHLNKSSGAISLHIPWDIPENTSHIKALAAQNDLKFDAMNSNTFQDQPDQKLVISLVQCNM